MSWAVLADPGLPKTTRLTVGVPPGWLDTPGELGVSSAPFTDASFFVPSGYGVWTLPIVHQPNLTGIAAPGPVSTPLGPVTIAYTRDLPALLVLHPVAGPALRGELRVHAVPTV